MGILTFAAHHQPRTATRMDSRDLHYVDLYTLRHRIEQRPV